MCLGLVCKLCESGTQPDDLSLDPLLPTHLQFPTPPQKPTNKVQHKVFLAQNVIPSLNTHALPTCQACAAVIGTLRDTKTGLDAALKQASA